MPIKNEIIEVETDKGICIYNITLQIQKILQVAAVKTGQILVFSRHTTTALAINENEERLLEDVKLHLAFNRDSSHTDDIASLVVQCGMNRGQGLSHTIVVLRYSYDNT